MPKKDYYDDPDAPKANSIVPAVTAIVQNNRGELRVCHRIQLGLRSTGTGLLLRSNPATIQMPANRLARQSESAAIGSMGTSGQDGAGRLT